MFADGEADVGLLFVAGQREVGVEEVVGVVDVAGRVGFADGDHHFGVGEAGHGAVGAAVELFGEEEAAVAGEDGDAALAFRFGGADGGDLREAGPVFVFQHHAVGVIQDHALDDGDSDLDAGGEWVVLEDPGGFGAEHFGDHVEVAGDAFVGFQAAGGGDHDAGGAVVHDAFGEFAHRGEAGGGDADDDGDAVVDAGEDAADEGLGFFGGEFGGFAHHAEDGEAGGAVGEVKVDHGVGAGEVEAAVVGEGGDGDDEDALGGFIELRHGDLLVGSEADFIRPTPVFCAKRGRVFWFFSSEKNCFLHLVLSCLPDPGWFTILVPSQTISPRRMVAFTRALKVRPSKALQLTAERLWEASWMKSPRSRMAKSAS